VALVGGGNSAGQAPVFLAPKVKRLHLIVRRSGLEATMSRYLIDGLGALANVELHIGTEVGDVFRAILQGHHFRAASVMQDWTGIGQGEQFTSDVSRDSIG
jgi:thioredoxin reductase